MVQIDLPSEQKDEPNKRLHGWNQFKPGLITSSLLADVFRVFTCGEKSNNMPNIPSLQNTKTNVVLATDGSCLRNREKNACAEAGVFYEENNPQNISRKVSEAFLQSNQTEELLAIKEAVERGPQNVNMLIETDSKYAINLVTKDLQKIEDSGFISVANTRLI